MHHSRPPEYFVKIITYLPLCRSKGMLQASHSSSSAASSLAVLLKIRSPQDHFQELLHRCWHEPAASGQHGKAEVVVRTSWSAASVHERASMGVWRSGRCTIRSLGLAPACKSERSVNTRGDPSEIKWMLALHLKAITTRLAKPYLSKLRC